MKDLRTNNIIIGLSYGVISLNCMITFKLSQASALPDYGLIALCTVFAVMIPISITDPRKEMHGRIATIVSICLQLGIGLMLSLFSLSWFLLCVVLVEFFVLLIVNWLLRK